MPILKASACRSLSHKKRKVESRVPRGQDLDLVCSEFGLTASWVAERQGQFPIALPVMYKEQWSVEQHGFRSAAQLCLDRLVMQEVV